MRRTRRRRLGTLVPVVSMGDIAFLLIIFFVLCSNFAKETGVKVRPPQAAAIDTLQNSSVAVAIDEQGVIYVDGQPVPDAGTVESRLTTLLKDKASPQDRTVAFRCDRSVRRDKFEPVLDAIAKAGGVIAAVGQKSQPQAKP